MKSLRTLAAIAIAAVMILVVTGPVMARTTEKSTAPVDLNTASQKDLEALPGVGPATAKKIIAGRPYAAVADLEKAGVSKATITKITPHVTVGSQATSAETTTSTTTKSTTRTKSKAAEASAGPVDLNTASQKDLEALPGVGPATAKKIIAGRPYAAVSDLAKAGVSKATITKITPQVTVGTPSAAAEPAASTTTETKATTTTSTTKTTSTTTAQTPPVKGMVWVNTSTKVFHREGDKYYGNTKHGKFMDEADAIKAGYREAKAPGTHKK